MPYHTASLPDPIRKQVETFIEFLLWKHGKQPMPEPETQPNDAQDFLNRWTGHFAGIQAEEAKGDYLTEKYS